jgi:dihydrofolate reductase
MFSIFIIPVSISIKQVSTNIEKNEKISLIVALSKQNRAIGFKNNLLWKIDGDLPRFKTLTTGHPIIMGRLTFESIGRPLPNRFNIVISRSSNVVPNENLAVVDSIQKALDIAKEKDSEEIFIIGGGKVYSDTIHYANRLYLTLVDDEPKEADAFFPDYSDFKKEISREEHLEHNPPFTYLILER